MEKSEYDRMYNLENTYWWYVGLHELVIHFIKQMYSEKLNILDAGCGTGRLMELIKPFGQIEGFDFSSDAVYFCRKRGLENVRLEDINYVTLADNHYDAIVSLDVLYHQAVENDESVMRTFYNAIKSNGILILNLPAFDFLHRSHNIFVHEKRRYRRKILEHQLSNIGFKIQKSTYRLMPLFFIILLMKLFESSSKPASSDLSQIPKWINALLLGLIRFENLLIKCGLRIPLGSSLFVVAKKP